ncbi:MAG: hypothetical protein EBW55_09220 [Betaproteobacteria bacterium]|nr:hypothetical protein [Betaproteobacteria bacterium]
MLLRGLRFTFASYEWAFSEVLTLTASFKLRIVSQPPNAWGIEPATVQALFCLTFFDLCSGQGALRRRLSARARAVAIA